MSAPGGPARPQIGDAVKFLSDGVLWQGTIMDIRPAPAQVGTWWPDGSGYHRFEPAYPPGAWIAYTAVLGSPRMFEVDLHTARVKRAAIWRAE